jgi:hypothetical protein
VPSFLLCKAKKVSTILISEPTDGPSGADYSKGGKVRLPPSAWQATDKVYAGSGQADQESCRKRKKSGGNRRTNRRNRWLAAGHLLKAGHQFAEVVDVVTMRPLRR